MFRRWTKTLGTMLLFSMHAVGQTSKRLTEEMPSSTEIAGAALQTYNNYSRAWRHNNSLPKIGHSILPLLLFLFLSPLGDGQEQVNPLVWVLMFLNPRLSKACQFHIRNGELELRHGWFST